MSTTIKKAVRQAKDAPKYVLEWHGMYIADNQDITGMKLTNNIKLALKYSVGFDQEQAKISYWSLYLPKGEKFTPVYL